jgi:hypothetical protein
MITKIKDISPRLAEVGKIKIGGKSEKKVTTQNKKTFQPPVKFDHFVVKKLARDQHGNLVPDKAIMDKIGPNARTLKGILMYDSIEMNFPTRYALYSGKKCICQGNGETAEWNDPNEGLKKIKCVGKDCKYMTAKKCKPNGRLYMILELNQKVGGAHVFRTTSWNSIQNILSSLAYIKIQTGGKLAGITFELEMIKKHTGEHGNTETVNIHYAGTETELRQAALAETKRRETYKIDMKKIEKLAIEYGVIEDTDLPGDVEDEYYIEDKKITNKSKALEINADAFSVPAPTQEIESEEKKDIPDDEVM